MNITKLKQYSKYLIKKMIQKDNLFKGDLREYQLNKINQVLNNAQQNSLFYQDFHKNSLTKLNSLEDIKKLPILKKEIFKKAIQENTILCNGYNKNNLDCGHTTGSTGTPLEMCFDKECTSKRTLVQSRLWKDMGILPHKRFVKIWRDKKLSKNELKLKDAGLLHPIAVGDVNDPISSATTNEKLQNIKSELQSFDPQVIRGYVSALYSIASLLELHNIKFKNLESVVTSAEYLPSQMWEYFEKVFGCTVYNLYGGTEAPSIAVNKKDSHNLTISEDLYFIEVLDENGNDVKPGEQGLITITDLYSKATPLIRYQIGDMAIVDEYFYKITNEFRYFTSVEGRTNDIFELEDGSLIYSHLWHIYFRDEDWVDRFQVIQQTKNSIEVKLLVKEKNNTRFELFKKRIENTFNGVDFIWTFIEKIELQSGNKYRAVISNVQNKFNLVNKE